MTTQYGETPSEKIANERLTCRQILNEINNFGINERQRTFLIYLLALELENAQACSDLSTVAADACKQCGINVVMTE